jgi:hypothetical protein
MLYVYGLAVVGIVTLWTVGLPWIALAAFLALVVMIFVRGMWVRRNYEVWMNDLARATERLMRSPDVRRTTSWPDE